MRRQSSERLPWDSQQCRRGDRTWGACLSVSRGCQRVGPGSQSTPLPPTLTSVCFPATLPPARVRPWGLAEPKAPQSGARAPARRPRLLSFSLTFHTHEHLAGARNALYWNNLSFRAPVQSPHCPSLSWTSQAGGTSVREGGAPAAPVCRHHGGARAGQVAAASGPFLTQSLLPIVFSGPGGVNQGRGEPTVQVIGCSMKRVLFPVQGQGSALHCPQ